MRYAILAMAVVAGGCGGPAGRIYVINDWSPITCEVKMLQPIAEDVTLQGMGCDVSTDWKAVRLSWNNDSALRTLNVDANKQSVQWSNTDECETAAVAAAPDGDKHDVAFDATCNHIAVQAVIWIR